jgi:hypothetical protein
MVLKNLRFLCKQLQMEAVDLNHEEDDYKLVVHSKVPGETTDFWFKEDKSFSWSWHTMISHLRDADIDFVCANMGRLDKQQDQVIERSDPGMGKGQDRSCGIVKCVFLPFLVATITPSTMQTLSLSASSVSTRQS